VIWGGLFVFLANAFRRSQFAEGGPSADRPGAPEDAEPDRGESEEEQDPPGKGGFYKPIMVGDPLNPEIAAKLAEMDDYFRSMGVDATITAKELTTLPKAPGRPVAIPVRRYWPNMAYTLVQGWNPIRRAMGEPLSVRGYRPPDYNKAVKGAPGSRHQDFSGLDIYATGGSKSRRRLALVTARLYLDKRDRTHRMGFGAYGRPNSSNVHIDFGWTSSKRPGTWEDGPYYIAEVGKVS
jgi:hypothetical protein